MSQISLRLVRHIGKWSNWPLLLAQPLAADPFVRRLAVAIGAGEIELADLEVGELHAALVSRLAPGALRSTLIASPLARLCR